MIAKSGRGVDGALPSMPRCITYNCTHSSALGKGRRDGDNPATATAAACSHTWGTVHCPPAIFEVQNPSTVSTSRGLAWIVSARGSLQTSQGLLNRTPKQGEGSVRE
jgi:hypothetical protein